MLNSPLLIVIIVVQITLQDASVAKLSRGDSGDNCQITERPYDEQYRPQYHFSAEANWINDPCGLIFYQGTYHLFYQLNPYDTQWGNMHWGHASSTDMVHWTHLPIAIYEEGGTMIFTGSSVYDISNTTGFGDAVTSPIVAIYTGHTPATSIQDQRLAYSLDSAVSFTKYTNNPVLDIGSANFRDPMVFWHDPSQQWIMAVTLSADRIIRIYGSADLKSWSQLSDFGPEGELGAVWECPNLFPLPVDGDDANVKWVMEVSVNGYESVPTVDYGIQYFIGEFDGTQFINDNPSDMELWVEQARDFYAPQSWNNIPASDGRRLWIGWFAYWGYAGSMPVSSWRGSMTVPRELKLVSTPFGTRMTQTPVVELESLHVQPGWSYSAHTIPELQNSITTDNVTGNTLDVSILLTATSDDGTFGIKLLQDDVYETVVGLNKTGNTFVAYADNTKGGQIFHPKYPDVYQMNVFPDANGVVDVRVFVDWSSVEVFVSSGYAAFCLRVFPPTNPVGLSVFGQNFLVDFTANRLTSIWS